MTYRYCVAGAVTGKNKTNEKAKWPQNRDINIHIQFILELALEMTEKTMAYSLNVF